MTNISSSNKDKDFTIPREIRDYYEYEFICVINKRRRFVMILRNHVQYFKLSLDEFKKQILKLILDELNETRNLSEVEKQDLIEFGSKPEDF